MSGSDGSITDRGQAPPLLRRGSGVEPVVALLEVADDAFVVLDGVVVVVLELGGGSQHLQPDPRMPGSIRLYGAASTATTAWPPSGWKSASWAARISSVPSESSTTEGRHTNCTRGVVAGRHAVLFGPTRLGPPVRGE